MVSPVKQHTACRAVSCGMANLVNTNARTTDTEAWRPLILAMAMGTGDVGDWGLEVWVRCCNVHNNGKGRMIGYVGRRGLISVSR